MKKILVLFCLAFLLLASIEAKSQWVQVWNGMGQTERVLALNWNGSFLLAGLYGSWPYPEYGVYISTNEGLTWSVTSLNDENIWNITSVGSNNYASSSDGIYISSNGTTWTSFALSNREVYDLAINGNYMYAGTDNYGVYYSTNNGVSWTQSFLNNKDIWSIAVYTNYVIAGTNGNGIYYSNDNGYIWNQSHLNNIDVERIRFDVTTAYAGTEDGIYKSTNFGVNWVQFGLSGKNINDIIFSGPYIYAGTDDDGVYVSTKQGLTWSQINDGFPSGDIDINALAFTNNYFVAGSTGKSAWRRPKSQVGIKQISELVPLLFSLKQNYPNPFNPVTNIKFDILTSEFITLKIYDILGKEVATLVNEKLNVGSYEVDWDASGYISGVYFYRLRAGDYVDVKKMILIK